MSKPTPQVQIGDFRYVAEGTWSNGNPIEDIGEPCFTVDAAREEANLRLAFLTDAERDRVRSMTIRRYIVDMLHDGVGDGIGSMSSDEVIEAIV